MNIKGPIVSCVVCKTTVDKHIGFKGLTRSAQPAAYRMLHKMKLHN